MARRKVTPKVTRKKAPRPVRVGRALARAAYSATMIPAVESVVDAMANPESGIKFVLGIAKQAGKRVSEVQSVIFDKLKWTTGAAHQWLKDHGFATPAADKAATFLRFRQQSPRKYKEFRTVVPGVHHNPEMRGRYEHPAPKRDWREAPTIEVTNGVEFAALQVRPDGSHAISMPDQEPFRRSGNVWLDATDAEWTVVQGGRRNPRISTGLTWARQKREQYSHNRWQLTIHHPHVPTRVFESLTQAQNLVARAKSYKGSHYDIYDRGTGEFVEQGVIGDRQENPDSTYQVRFIRPDQAGELMDLFHLARTALSGGDASNYNRMLWASKEFSKAHPEVSSTAAYKDLDGLRSNWFGARNPSPDLAASISSYDEHLGITTRPEFQEASPDEQAAAMTAMDLCENPLLASNPYRPSQRAWINTVLANDEESTDEDLVEYFVAGGVPRGVAVEAVSHRTEALKGEWRQNPSIPTPAELQPPFSPARVRDFGLTLVHQLGGEPRNYLHEVGVHGQDPDAVRYLQDAGYHKSYGWLDCSRHQWWVYRKEYPLSVGEWAGQVGTVENPSDLSQSAFDAAKDFRLSGAYDATGVANAGVAKYGFNRWYNNLAFGSGGKRPPYKARLLKAWMEGWAAGKRVEKRQGNPRSKRQTSEAYLNLPIEGMSQVELLARKQRLDRWLDETTGPQSYSMVREAWEATRKALSRVEGKSNPESSAASLYEDFHGKPPGEVKEIITTRHDHEWLTQLGTLVELKVATVTNLDATISFAKDKDAPDLCSSEDGRQLYIEGGQQEIDLKALKMSDAKWLKDSMVIGILYELTYQTAKGFHRFKPTSYFHKLGEETGEQPTLIYDPNNGLLSISGGQYRTKDVGIVN